MWSHESAIHREFHHPDTRIYAIVQGTIWAFIALSIFLFAADLVLRVGSYRPPQLGLFAYSRSRRFVDHVLGRLHYCAKPLIMIDIVTVLALYPALRGLRAVRLPLYVVAEILDTENVAHAISAGADEVIETTRLGFSLLAHAVAEPGTATSCRRWRRRVPTTSTSGRCLPTSRPR